MRSDEQLMSEVAKGNLDAFEQLVRRHQTSAWNAAFHLLNSVDDAEDIAQEAFLRIFRAAHRYQPTAAFRTYLYRIVTRLCRDRRRKVLPFSSPDLNAVTSKALSSEDVVSAGEDRRVVQKALGSLPVKQREAIVLRYYESLSYEEIGQSLGTSRKGVERLLARGRTALASLLGDLFGK